MTKLRLVHRRSSVAVHGIDCEEIGRGREETGEAPSAIALVEALRKSVADVIFFECVTFASVECGGDKPAPPRISKTASLDVKVVAITEWAEECGWEWDDQGQTVILTREGSESQEIIRITFNAKTFDPKVSRYAYKGIMEPIPNIEYLMARIGVGPGETVTRERRRTEKALPFNPLGDSDEDILAAVYGRNLVWVNSFTGFEETGAVMPLSPETSRHTRIEYSGTGRRILTFCDGGKNYRSVALESLLAVK